jgi:hypothetical protein
MLPDQVLFHPPCCLWWRSCYSGLAAPTNCRSECPLANAAVIYDAVASWDAFDVILVVVVRRLLEPVPRTTHLTLESSSWYSIVCSYDVSFGMTYLSPLRINRARGGDGQRHKPIICLPRSVRLTLSGVPHLWYDLAKIIST